MALFRPERLREEVAMAARSAGTKRKKSAARKKKAARKFDLEKVRDSDVALVAAASGGSQ